MSFIDLTGQTFSLLTILSRDRTKRRTYWNCRCACGTVKSIRADGIMSGNVVSCGCHRNATNAVGKHTTHGLSHIPEYAVWNAMKTRCSCPNTKGFHNYGNRGITVCARWHSFERFISDMGTRPSSKHSIERVDNNSGYSPENCVWATNAEQANNKRNNKLLEFRGVVKTYAQWSHIVGLNRVTLKSRLSRNWSVERALTTPVNHNITT